MWTLDLVVPMVRETNTNTALSPLTNSEQYPGSLLLIIVVKISKYLHNSGEKKRLTGDMCPVLYLNI